MSTQDVVLELATVTIDAVIEMDGNVALGPLEVFIQTDYTERIAVNPADLTEYTFKLLCQAAEKQHDKFMDEDINGRF